jgi:ABC-2 type transport system ATP-binding protein
MGTTVDHRIQPTAHNELAIRIHNARKDYGASAGGRRLTVDDVSVEVSRGAIHGLLGPNGAGKTTTLKMLLGLVRPTSGTFEIEDRDARSARARTSVGFLPEQPYFPTNLRADEALRLYGRLSGMADAEIARDSTECLRRVGLEDRGSTLLARFSRGMLQRFGLAQALLGSPSVLVLDEPASGLDPVGQRDIRNLMLELRSSGVTLLLSSHQLSEVEAVCDEVSILNRGAVAARGHIDDLLNVAGQTSIKARGDGDLPVPVAALVTETAFSSGMHVFSVPDRSVRHVVDALDDADGWTLVSIQPKRDSLEDYFARLLETPESATSDPGVAEEVA